MEKETEEGQTSWKLLDSTTEKSWIIHCEKIYPMNEARGILNALNETPNAILVTNEKIQFVGRLENARKIMPHCKVFHIPPPATILPGFIDSHVHPIFGGCQLLNCNVFDCANLDEALEKIYLFCEQNPDMEWILGSGWRDEWYLKNQSVSFYYSLIRFEGARHPREILDSVTDRPAILRRFDSHAAWVNSKALDIAQIPKDIQLRYGKVDFDSSGIPTGKLFFITSRDTIFQEYFTKKMRYY
jgi:predicted amidohydrolase YtcJ